MNAAKHSGDTTLEAIVFGMLLSIAAFGISDIPYTIEAWQFKRAVKFCQANDGVKNMNQKNFTCINGSKQSYDKVKL